MLLPAVPYKFQYRRCVIGCKQPRRNTEHRKIRQCFQQTGGFRCNLRSQQNHIILIRFLIDIYVRYGRKRIIQRQKFCRLVQFIRHIAGRDGGGAGKQHTHLSLVAHHLVGIPEFTKKLFGVIQAVQFEMQKKCGFISLPVRDLQLCHIFFKIIKIQLANGKIRFKAKTIRLFFIDPDPV